MSITNGLREYVNGPAKSGISHICENAILNIADRIDAEHQKAIRELNNLSDASVLLPVDADGEVIHIGDFMENLREDLEPQLHHRFKVYGILYRDYGQVCALTEDGYPSLLYRANECRHYHKPTVEDVLREFTHAILNQKAEYREQNIAEYATKLRLADDVEGQ